MVSTDEKRDGIEQVELLWVRPERSTVGSAGRPGEVLPRPCGTLSLPEPGGHLPGTVPLLPRGRTGILIKGKNDDLNRYLEVH